MPVPPDDVFLYLSRLLGRRVREAGSGGLVGRLHEAAVRRDESYPRVTRVFVRSRHLPARFLDVPWSGVRDFGNGGLVVDRAALEPVREIEAPPGELLLREDVLDRQVVDVMGAKLVRVNDIHLLHAEGSLHLAHVDIGTRGLLRRLGFERPVVRFVRWLFGYEMKERLVGWKEVHRIPGAADSPHRGTRLSLGGRLAELHPADLADIMEELGPRTREVVFHSLPVEAAAEALEETEIDVQVGLIESMARDKAADILEQMSSPAAADLLGDLPTSRAEVLLEEMNQAKAESVRELLVHPDETAGGIMTTAILRLREERTAGEALEAVRRSAETLDVLYYLYAVDGEGRLLGVLSMKDLFRAPVGASLETLLTRKVISVSPDTGKDEVVRLFSKYGFRAIPVVDAEGGLMGVIRFRAIVSAVAPELS